MGIGKYQILGTRSPETPWAIDLKFKHVITSAVYDPILDVWLRRSYT